MHIELSLPEGISGDWELKSFYQNGIKYQKLTHKGVNMMLNTPNIVADFIDFLTRAEGSILINGLGIGMCCEHLLKKSTVTDLTVIEYEIDAINLIAPYFEKDPRCRIIHGDAFTYESPKGKRYNYVWHDIWTMYSSRNLKEMDILFDKYKDIADWQGAWKRQACLDLMKKEQKSLSRFR